MSSGARPPSRVPKLGKNQRGVLALVIDRGGSMLVNEGRIIGGAWSSTIDYVRSIDGLIFRGYLTCNTETTLEDSRLFVTPEGRKLIKNPLEVISKCIENYLGLFDGRSVAMMDDVIAALDAGNKVGLIVEDRKRRSAVKRVLRYVTMNKPIYIATAEEAGLDLTTLTPDSNAGYIIFVEPYLIEKYVKRMSEYLKRYP